MRAPAKNTFPPPRHREEAAALPLSSTIAYRALFMRGALRVGEHVLLPGSGVRAIALTIAKAGGASVSVTSRSEDKLARARHLGADHAVRTAADWTRELP